MVSPSRTDICPPPVTAAWLVQSADAESHTTYTGEIIQGRVRPLRSSVNWLCVVGQSCLRVVHTYLIPDHPSRYHRLDLKRENSSVPGM